ncbi:hypothetical protein tb265_29940 [Gemmatimonadetes bacterium T265]|nr:hypothetical protein tb265_29940 [Gemmatimonadetes bacterium T265]
MRRLEPPRAAQSRFPAEGSHPARYAARFPAVEINSSFKAHCGPVEVRPTRAVPSA